MARLASGAIWPEYTQIIHNLRRASVDEASSLAIRSNGEAAVLVSLYQHGRQPFVMLTRRSSTLRQHAGEVALPGGRRDRTDKNAQETAMREANEEIGVPLTKMKTVSTLAWTWSKAADVVHPIVATGPRPIFHAIPADDNVDDYSVDTFEPKLNPGEVEALFVVPLRTFLESKYHTAKEIKWKGKPYLMHHFNLPTTLYCMAQPHGIRSNHVETFHCWGLTSHILLNVAQIAFQRKPEFSMEVGEGPSKTDPLERPLKTHNTAFRESSRAPADKNNSRLTCRL